MFGERCARCFVKADKIRLFDVIYDGKMDLLCERCAIIENIPLIIKPNENLVHEADSSESVSDRMKNISGINIENKKLQILRIERLKELEENPGLVVPVAEKPDLIEHFNWILLRERRRKGLTQEKLAEKVRLPAEYIELLEKGNIPNNIEIIKKLENFFNMNFIKKSDFREVLEELPILLDEYGNVLDHIPEPEIENKFSEDEYTDELIKRNCEQDFDIHKADVKKVSLKDLMEIHRRKILASKEEKQEQKEIEEKKNISEARKEELRLFREKQSKELDNILGGRELLDNEKRVEENIERKNKIDKLFNKAFGE